jgi:hypothetical protein
MKRSIIGVAALLLLLSSATYAAPPRPRPRPGFVLGRVLAWFGLGQHWQVRVVRPCPPAPHPPAFAHSPKAHYDRGWHWGWLNGRRIGHGRNDSNRRDRRDSERPRDGEHEQGHGGGRK